MDVFVNLWFSVRPFEITKLKVHFSLTHKKTTVFGTVAREHVYVHVHKHIHEYIHTHTYTHLCACTHTDRTKFI